MWNPFKKKQEIVGPAKTTSYQPYYSRFWRQPRDLPPFAQHHVEMMMRDPTIKLGLGIRAAAITGTEFAYKEVDPKTGKDKWIPGVKADNPYVAEYVYEQIKALWKLTAEHSATSQSYGWAAGEITWKFDANNRRVVDSFLPRHANDCRVLIKNGKPVGVRFLRIKENPLGREDIFFPNALWVTHKPEPGTYYGTSIQEGAYSPWYDKNMDHGALDVRRLFMVKDSYGGVDMTYPAGTTSIDGKGEVPNQNIAREIAEQIQAGGITVRPAQYDDNNNEMWTIKRATIPGNPQHILQFPKDLDVEELRGLEIPDDILTSENTGAWNGKSIPLMAFYQGLETWRSSIVNAHKASLDLAVESNFGPNQHYELTAKPLAIQAMEQQQGENDQSNFARPQQPDPYADHQESDPIAAVGKGVLRASILVDAANRVIEKRVKGCC